MGCYGKTTDRFVTGDVAILHGDPEYAGACFSSVFLGALGPTQKGGTSWKKKFVSTGTVFFFARVKKEGDNR